MFPNVVFKDEDRIRGKFLLNSLMIIEENVSYAPSGDNSLSRDFQSYWLRDLTKVSIFFSENDLFTFGMCELDEYQHLLLESEKIPKWSDISEVGCKNKKNWKKYYLSD